VRRSRQDPESAPHRYALRRARDDGWIAWQAALSAPTVIRRCDTAENGDIIVALVDQEEATLKRLRKKGTTIALEAANPEFKTRIFGPDQVDIQGRLVGLLRRY